MRVLVVRHHEEDAPGMVGDAFAARGAAVESILYPAEAELPGPGDADHVVILGSTESVYARSPWIEAELDWLRHTPVPVLGICFGAQLLATAHGGSVERSLVYEIGWETVDPVRSAGFDAPIGRGPWFQFHGDRCVLPQSAELLAENEVGVQAFAIGRALGVQFHPELDAAQLERWFEGGGREQVVAVGKDPDALLAQTADEEPHARVRASSLVDTYLAYGRPTSRPPLPPYVAHQPSAGRPKNTCTCPVPTAPS